MDLAFQARGAMFLLCYCILLLHPYLQNSSPEVCLFVFRRQCSCMCISWLLGSWGFSIYINNLHTYNFIYGTIAGFAIMMILELTL